MREPGAALPRGLTALPRSLAALPGRLPTRLVRPPRGLALSPRMRLRLLAAAAAVVALGSLYQLWLRDSALVAVTDVDVTGLTTRDAPHIRAALTAAARDMTTLHLDRDQLDELAATFPVIRSLELSTDFPHGLRIHVSERRPAALVAIDGTPLPVAADGTVLRGLRPPRGLPLLKTAKPQSGSRLGDVATLRALAVVGAAPAGFPQRIERVTEGKARGLVVTLRDGPELVFGRATRVAAKWAAAVRVLADAQAEGASYVDVRLPERPVAGGLPAQTIEPVLPAGEPIPAPAAEPTPVPAENPQLPVEPSPAPSTSP